MARPPDYSCGKADGIIRYIPIASGFISIIGSCLIIYPIVRQSRFKKAYHRFLFSLSFVDIIMSLRFIVFGLFLDPNDDQPSLTCTLNGVGTMISVSAPLYNCALSIYFLLYIRFGVNERFLRQKVEVYIHIVCILYPLFLAVMGLSLTVYNPSVDPGAGNCVAEKYPINCGSAEIPCSRGKYAEMFVWMSSGIPLCLVFVILIGSNYLVYMFVRDIELSSSKYHTRNQIRRWSWMEGEKFQNSLKTSNTQLVASQSFLYVAAYMLCWIWTLITRSVHLVNIHGSTTLCVLEVIKQIFLPMQGFFNYLVYVRPKYLSWKKKFPKRSRLWAFKQATFAVQSKKTNRERMRSISNVKNNSRRNSNTDFQGRLHLQDDLKKILDELKDMSLESDSDSIEETNFGQNHDPQFSKDKSSHEASLDIQSTCIQNTTNDSQVSDMTSSNTASANNNDTGTSNHFQLLEVKSKDAAASGDIHNRQNINSQFSDTTSSDIAPGDVNEKKDIQLSHVNISYEANQP